MNAARHRDSAHFTSNQAHGSKCSEDTRRQSAVGVGRHFRGTDVQRLAYVASIHTVGIRLPRPARAHGEAETRGSQKALLRLARILYGSTPYVPTTFAAARKADVHPRRSKVCRRLLETGTGEWYKAHRRHSGGDKPSQLDTGMPLIKASSYDRPERMPQPE